MNIPNALTTFRIIIGLIIPWMILQGDFSIRVWAAVLFAIASFTDWLDGWYARRYNLITKLGKILDPIADKIIVLGSFIILSDLFLPNMYSIWWIVPIIAREIIITMYRFAFLLKKKPVVVAASWSGKAKTVMQMMTLPCAYFYFMFNTYPIDDPLGSWFFVKWLLYGMLIMSLALTVGSGLVFFIKNWKSIKEVSEIS